jgi:Ner family transcriptional regulator
MDRAQSGAVESGWHQQDILAEVRKRGATISSLSRDHGLSRGTLQTAFYKRYPRGQRIIAEFLGLTCHELWPHWFGPNDELLPLQGGNNRPKKAA